MTSDSAQNNSTLEKESNDLVMKLAIIRTLEAEKRTHLAELRTGIGILTIPLSLLTILIATSNYYSVNEALVFIFGLVTGIIIMAVIGMYLVIRALIKLRRGEHLRMESKLETEAVVKDWAD